jgi:carbonic anhydrase
MDILRPGFERISHLPDGERGPALEKQAVLVSLENLMTFPFVREAVEGELLTLHGLWNDIGEGSLEQYDLQSASFQPI